MVVNLNRWHINGKNDEAEVDVRRYLHGWSKQMQMRSDESCMWQKYMGSMKS
jgi:hypothetical protein